MQKLFILLSSFVFFAFSSASAQTPWKQPPVRNFRPAPVTASLAPSSDVAPARFRLAPAIGIMQETLGYGALAEMTFSTGVPFFIGVQSGYLQWTSEASETGRPQMISIPILASFVYRFDLKNGAVHPYLGVSLGVALTSGELDGADSGSSSFSTSFQAAARPGVEFDLSKTTSLFVEPQVGFLKSQFLFNPQVGLAFSF